MTMTLCIVTGNSADQDDDIHNERSTLTLSKTTLQRQCVAGSYIDNDLECHSCNPGKYQTIPKTSGPCFTCPAGSYSEIGTGTKDTCTSCPKGRISNKGAGSCTKCEAGKYIDSFSSTECKLCQAGKFSIGDTENCDDCPAGSYSTLGQGKSSTCTKCPAGFKSSKGEGEGPRQFFGELGSKKCPIESIAVTKENCKFSNTINDVQYPLGCISISGTINWNDAHGVGHSNTQVVCYQNAPCNPCLAGTSSSEGASECTPCPVNTFSTGGQNSSSCTSCKANTFADEGAGITPECSVCALGRYSHTSGFCEDCSPGNYSDVEASTECKPCLAGYFGKDRRMTTPQCSGQCPVGRYSGGGLSECTECPTGKLAPIGSDSIDDCQHLCYPGYWMNKTNSSNYCIPCAKGKYSDNVGIKHPDQCKGCLPGTYGEIEGQAFCHSCPAAKYQNKSNASTCSDCPIGKTAPAQSSICTICELGQEPKPEQDACQPCKAGYYRSNYEMLACSECPAGKFAAKGSSSCQLCPRGRYGSDYLGDKKSSNCAGSCLPGRYGLGGSLTDQCDGPCPRGSFSVNGASTKTCTLCSSGRYSNNLGSTNCSLCTIGTFAQNDGSVTCSSCPAGRFSDRNGTTSCENKCDPGTYGLGGSTTSACDGKCPPGSYSAEGATTEICNLCKAGMYNNAYGASACDNVCEKGKYSSQGASICSQCPAGRIGWREGAESENECIHVFPGTFSDGKNITHGQLCPEGTYQDEPGQLTCKSCLPGRFGAEEGLQTSNCSGLCPPGFYSSIRASKCQPCEAGKYNPYHGEEVCKKCTSEETSLKQATACVCKESYYMNHNQSCIPCMNGANCSSIGNAINSLRLEKGYWRASNESINVFACPMENTCDERIHHSNGSTETSVACAVGNTGVMCAVCAQNYYRPSKSAACVKCGDGGLSAFFLFCGIILSIVGLMLILYFNNKGGSGGIMRSAINFIQYMTVMLAFESEWPTFLKVLSQILSGLSFDFISTGYTSPQCLFKLNYYQSFALMSSIVVFVTIILGITFHFYVQRKEPDRARRWNRWKGLFLRNEFIILLFVYPVMSGQALSFFRCKEIEGIYYLMQDYSLQCYTTDWWMYSIFIWFFLFTFTIGLPLAVWFHLKMNESKLDDEDFKSLFDVFYSPYRKETYYFETVTMFFKLALWSSLVFFPQKSETQMATALVANTLNLVVLAYLEPYKGSLINLLQMGVLLITCGINFTGLILNYLNLSKEYNTHVTKSISKANSILRQTNATKLLIQVFSIALMSLLIGSLIYRNLPKFIKYIRSKILVENTNPDGNAPAIELKTNPLQKNTKSSHIKHSSTATPEEKLKINRTSTQLTISHKSVNSVPTMNPLILNKHLKQNPDQSKPKISSNWIKYKDEGTRKHYWYNETTDKSTWDDPSIERV